MEHNDVVGFVAMAEVTGAVTTTEVGEEVAFLKNGDCKGLEVSKVVAPEVDPIGANTVVVFLFNDEGCAMAATDGCVVCNEVSLDAEDVPAA